MSRHYEITDGNLHVGWASEDYMFTQMDERVLKGEANFDFHVGDGDAVDVAPVRYGHWIEAKYPLFTCSECGATYQDIGYGYCFCPSCGAKMEEVEE